MKIKLNRKEKTADYTIGNLFLDGKFLCNTLEPPCRKPGEPKVPGKTAIPAGRYPVVITFSPKFKQWLPLLLHVPGFTGIRIHRGNTAADTAGCILLGDNREEGAVLDSKLWTDKLILAIVKARARGESVWIKIE